MADEYFILSLRWTKENYATWWCPNNSGYTSVIDDAGRYSRADVDACPGYYNNGHTTIAIPCADVENAAQRVVFDYAWLKLIAPRRVTRATLNDSDEEPCEACGASVAATNVGLRIVGVGQ